MELALDRAYANIATLTATGPAARWTGYLMDGTPPETAAELAALVDMRDLAAVHNKSIGNFVCSEQQYMTLRESGATILSMWPLTDQPTLLKGGSKPHKYYPAYQVYIPDRISRVDGKLMDFLHSCPQFISAPLLSNNYPTLNDAFEAFAMKDSAADPSVVEYQLEYDNARVVTAVRYGGVGTSETTYCTAFALQYYDEATSTWVTALTTAITAAHNLGGNNFVLTAPVTAKKFRMQFTIVASATSAVVRRWRPTVLLGAEVLSDPVVNPTWAILIPSYWWYYGNVSTVGWVNFKKNVAEYKYLPAIIDTAGPDGSGAKMVLNPATGHGFVSYSMVLGNIK